MDDRRSARASLFHDDTPLNADAVVKHFERLQDPATACPCKTTVDNIESMEMPDGPEGLTVVFNLATPERRLPRHAWPAPAATSSRPPPSAAGVNFKTDGVGTGPFKFDEYVAGERTVLVKWDKYWQTDEDGIQLPYLDKLTIGADPGQPASA